jgi:uncharacterized protein YecE (DUF72 family)
VQLPPFLRKDLTRLTEFLDVLPAGLRAAFEFRHESWLSDDVYETLRAKEAALCIADGENLSAPLVRTAPWGYLRLRRQDYTEGDLAQWADRIREQPWRETWVFFKHEDEGAGPALAARLTSLVD